MAKHVKYMSDTSSPKVTSFRTDVGQTEPGKETVDHLLNAHYPGIQPLKPTIYDRNKTVNTKELQENYKDWINMDRLKSVLKNFKAKKSPGPDGLKPVVLTQLPPNILKILILIYKACIHLHFTPTRWKNASIIFIPKPGKDSYHEPKSFRPISLSNYLLKALEKLAVWNTEETLIAAPLHANQHGFQKGHCTETAISKTVGYIEQNLSKGNYCIAVFMDIKGAFDTICPEHIKTTLLEKGCLLYTSPSPRD